MSCGPRKTNMNILQHIFKSIEYRLSRLVFWLYIYPVGRLKFMVWNKPIVASKEDTLLYIIDHKSSICRYGDGELNLIWGIDLGFQTCNPEISRRMKEVFDSDEENMLIGLPDIFDDLDHYTDFSHDWWRTYLYSNIDKLKQIIKPGRHYFCSNITRFTSDYKEDQADKLIPLYRKIWDGRDIYIVEGEQTRIGVGNDLLSNAKNLYRILAPVKNAYDKYDEIVAAIKEHVPWGSLVILALGPTATIMAYDLAKMGYQALDLGHFDIQYEYHIRGIHSKQPIPGKYVNEASTAGQTVDDSVIKDENYSKSIIKRVI